MLPRIEISDTSEKVSSQQTVLATRSPNIEISNDGAQRKAQSNILCFMYQFIISKGAQSINDTDILIELGLSVPPGRIGVNYKTMEKRQSTNYKHI